MAACTRDFNSSETYDSPFITRETDLTLTPATAATSRMVGRKFAFEIDCSGMVYESSYQFCRSLRIEQALLDDVQSLRYPRKASDVAATRPQPPLQSIGTCPVPSITLTSP